MRLLIVHHPGAGRGEPDRETMTGAFERAGHQVRYQSAETPDWKVAIGADVDLVLAAGGDGTIRRVAIALAERGAGAPPLAVLALGTANNIARSLGATAALDDTAANLAGAIHRRLAIGIVRAPWGDARFVESAGLGAVARLIRESPAKRPPPEERPDPETELANGVAHLREVLARSGRRPIRVLADGVDLSAPYLLVEVMNTASIGPDLRLAPFADAAADTLRLVLAGEPERPLLESYLDRIDGVDSPPAPIPSRAVRRVVIDWPPEDGHLDDKPWPSAAAAPVGGAVTIEIDSTIGVAVPEGSG